MWVRCKFKLSTVTERIGSKPKYDEGEKKHIGYQDCSMWEAEFQAVSGGTGDENSEFWNTPLRAHSSWPPSSGCHGRLGRSITWTSFRWKEIKGDDNQKRGCADHSPPRRDECSWANKHREVAAAAGHDAKPLRR